MKAEWNSVLETHGLQFVGTIHQNGDPWKPLCSAVNLDFNHQVNLLCDKLVMDYNI